MLSGSYSSPSTTLAGIDPPDSIAPNPFLMLCPEGRTVARTPLLLSRIMSGLYDWSTLRLSALGWGVLASHQMYSTESLIRTRRTLTHSAGAGIFAGLYQKHSCAK